MPLICFKGHVLLLKTTSVQITLKAFCNNSIQEKKNIRNFRSTVLTLKLPWLFYESCFTNTGHVKSRLTDVIWSLLHFNVGQKKQILITVTPSRLSEIFSQLNLSQQGVETQTTDDPTSPSNLVFTVSHTLTISDFSEWFVIFSK